MTKRITVKVNDIIKANGMTKIKFSETVGIRPATICEYAKNDGMGMDKVSLKNLAKIAEVMQIDDISQLLVLEDIEE